MNISIYQPSDHKAVLELHRIALEAVGAYIPSGSWDNDLQDIESNYLEPRGTFIVGKIDNKLVAMGALRPASETTAELKRLRVHPDYQKRGFGQKILNELETNAKSLGYSKIVLDTSPKQVGAQHLFLKNGFKETHRAIYAAPNPEGEPIEMIFFEKDL